MSFFLISRQTLAKIGNDTIRAFATKSSDGGKKVGFARKGVVLGAYAGCGGELVLTKTAKKFNDRVGGKMLDMIKDAGGTVARGKCHVFNNIDPEFWSVCLAGLGQEGVGYNEVEALDMGSEAVRVAAAAGATRLRKEGIGNIYIEDMGGRAESAAEGATLACWRFQDNMLKSNRKPIPTLELYESTDTDGWTRGLFKAEAQNLARKLCDMPANHLTPTSFAQAAVDALCPVGVNVDVRDKDWIEDQDLNTFLHVAKGSCEPPVLLELTYCGGAPDDKPVLMIGTGTTFDSGGISIKRCRNMAKYRAAMAGAACIVASMRAAASLCLPINITGVLPMCEHLPSGLAMKPGDVITAKNGVTIMVQDCDKECRVVLADIFLYAFKAHRPKLMMDITCLTDGVRNVLGQGGTGLWTNNKSYWKQMKKAGSITGDRMWRLPLWKFYTRELVAQRSCDITNRTKFHGDSCTGAAFLKEFVPKCDWIHLDVTGVAFPTKTPNLPYLRIDRMTGRPTRTIIQFLQQLACKDGDSAKKK